MWLWRLCMWQLSQLGVCWAPTTCFKGMDPSMICHLGTGTRLTPSMCQVLWRMQLHWSAQGWYWAVISAELQLWALPDMSDNVMAVMALHLIPILLILLSIRRLLFHGSSAWPADEKDEKDAFIFFGCVACSSCTFPLLLSNGCLLVLLSVLLTSSSFIFVAAWPLAVPSVSCHHFRNACCHVWYHHFDASIHWMSFWTALCHCSLVSLSRKEKKRLHLSASI